VADAEDRNAEIEDFFRADRRVLAVDRLRSAGKNDRARCQLADLGDGKVKRVDDRIHALLANASCDQLCVLRSEVENEDGLRWLHFWILWGQVFDSSVFS